MVYPQAIIGSEIFNRLRSSEYTPSVTPVGRDSSLREGAKRGAFPAPSLRELSSECETEGVSFDGCSMPTIYTPAHMNSETFERLRSSGYTPSVTPIRACQLPQRGSRDGLHHSPHRPKTARFRAIFIAPTELKSFYIPPFNRVWAIFIAPKLRSVYIPPFGKKRGKKYGYFGTAQWD